MRGRGCAWQGGMCGRGCERQGGMHGGGGHAWQGGVHGGRDGHSSGWYASHWNAFLLEMFSRHSGIGLFYHASSRRRSSSPLLPFVTTKKIGALYVLVIIFIEADLSSISVSFVFFIFGDW